MIRRVELWRARTFTRVLFLAIMPQKSLRATTGSIAQINCSFLTIPVIGVPYFLMTVNPVTGNFPMPMMRRVV